MKAKKYKSSFFTFLVFSACVHLTVFYFVQKNSLWFYSPIKENKVSQQQIKLQKKDKEKILKQFIATIPKYYSIKS